MTHQTFLTIWMTFWLTVGFIGLFKVVRSEILEHSLKGKTVKVIESDNVYYGRIGYVTDAFVNIDSIWVEFDPQNSYIGEEKLWHKSNFHLKDLEVVKILK